MALELSLSVSSEANDGTSITIADVTGDYNASTNEGGYGTPNPTRASLRLYMLPLKKAEDGTPTILDVDNTDADTITSWEIEIENDGWHSFGVLACSAYSASADYSISNIVFSDVTNQIYITKKSNGIGSTVVNPATDSLNETWGTIESGDIDVNEVLAFPSNYGIEDSFILNQIITGRSNKYYAVQVANNFDTKSKTTKRRIEYLQLFLNAALINETIERYAEGERAILTFNEIANGGIDCI